jgi:hypothetical protein
MPTVSTYLSPGQYGATGPMPGSTFGAQTQSTSPGAAAFTTVTTWSQAATHWAGVTCSEPPRPHGYHHPFISWANVASTGWPNASICCPKLVRYASYAPAAMLVSDGTRPPAHPQQFHGSSSTKVSMPSAYASSANVVSNGSRQPL